MNYAYATCLLNESNAEINEENLTAVLEAAECSVQDSRVKAVVAALEDIDIDEIAAAGLEYADEELEGDESERDLDDSDQDVDGNSDQDVDGNSDQDVDGASGGDDDDDGDGDGAEEGNGETVDRSSGPPENPSSQNTDRE